MTEVSNWKKIDKENTAIDDLTLSAPQGSYWQKMMGAIKRMFGAVDERVTALEQSGGGGEEQFQKVYETTLEDASESDTLTISSVDMGGSYVDVVVYASIPEASDTDSYFVDFLSDNGDLIMSGSVALDENGGTYAHNALFSFGGLTLGLSNCFWINSSKSESYVNFFSEQQEYPTSSCPGVASINLIVGGVGATHVFPASTTITVYARRKVIAAAGGE